MINPPSHLKPRIPVTVLAITGIYLLISFLFLFYIIKSRNLYDAEHQKRIEYELINGVLLKEKKELELKISNYAHFSDSISKVIEKNNQITNSKLKDLINYSNDELRKIANDQ